MKKILNPYLNKEGYNCVCCAPNNPVAVSYTHLVEGENQITELDEHHRHHQRTQMQALLHKLHYRMLQGIDFLLLVPVEEHLGTAVNQESSEYE